MDQPRLGFNTNWIAVTVDSYDANNDVALYVFPKYEAECSANITPSLSTFAALNTPTGTALNKSCVAETYQTFGQDPDGSTLYLVSSNDLSNGIQSATADSICLSSITGTPESPVLNPNVSCPVESGSIWSTTMPDLTQPGSSQKINLVNFDDDRIESCVVRNYGIWVTQQVGLPSSSPTGAATQWWNVGVDSYLGNIYAFQRIGEGNDSLADNALYPSIGVNYYSDLLIGFTQVSSKTPPSSSYVYKDYRDVLQNSTFMYDSGHGPYQALPSPNNRLGDYSHGTDDPLDDFTLWTTEGFSNSLLTSSPKTYGWQSSYAFVYPHTTPYFVDSASNYLDCPQNATCSDTVQAPKDLQPGDVVLANIDLTAVSQSNPTVPTGWQLLNISNIGNGTTQQLSSSEPCGLHVNSWLAAHVYQQNESSYKFSHFDNGESTCFGNSTGNLGVMLAAYRGARSNLANLKLYGFPSTNDSNSFSVPTLDNVPGNTTLVTTFTGPAGPYGEFPDYAPVAGSPTLLTESSYSSLLADVSVPYSGNNYGIPSYSTYDIDDLCEGNGGLCLWYAWQILVSP